MKTETKKKIKIISIIGIIILFIALVSLLFVMKNKNDIEGFKRIETEEEFNNFINYNEYNENRDIITRLLTLPISLFGSNSYRGYGYGYKNEPVYEYSANDVMDLKAEKGMAQGTVSNSAFLTDEGAREQETLISDDYSKTNIQVENVDEADRVKTNGKYIFTINNEVVNVVDATDNNNLKLVKKIKMDNAIPMDIMLGTNKLAVIGSTKASYDQNTKVEIYDINDDFKLLSSYVYKYNYVTSRMIGDRIIVITNGYYGDGNYEYKVNDNIYDLDYKNVFVNRKYFDYGFTYIANIDLSDLDKCDVYGLSLFTDQVYVSEDNIYIIKDYYDYVNEEEMNVLSILGLKGIFGVIDMYDYDTYRERTKIVKISIEKNNKLNIKKEKSIEGRVINQFSFDEKDGYLRVALDRLGEDSNTSGVVILDKNLNVVDKIDGLAEDERIYAARFIGDRLYLVTYRNMDPLFVISLKDNKIKVLGELKIPGYSNYLHPYDDNHIIGIGVDTKEHIMYDDFGRVINSSVENLGLKMAIFDVTDVSNPTELSKVTIGDSNTTSNILANHKALLFSKEKGIIAIPVRQYKTYNKGRYISFSGETIEDINNAYLSQYTNDVSDNGFAVYNINLDEGLKLKGYIYHESLDNYDNDYRYYYYNSYNNVPVRGLYIKDNLYTVSNDYIKVNKISNLNLISSLKLK